MFLESTAPVCTYPWYLPDGLSPDSLLAAACKSPADLTAYVARNLDQRALYRFLAESFCRMPLHDNSTTRAVFRPLVSASSVAERWSEAPSAFALLVKRLGLGSPGVYYSLTGDDASWSVSWPHVLLSLDELLTAPVPVTDENPRVSAEDLYDIQLRQCVGWLGVLLLPTLRIYNPCAYECAIARLYSTLIHNIPLFTKANSYAVYAQTEFTWATFKRLREVNFNSFDITQPGLLPALSLVGGYDAKRKLREDSELKCLYSADCKDTFNAAIKTQLLLTVPLLRSFPNDNVPVSQFLGSYGISLDVLHGKLDDNSEYTGFIPSTPETIDVYADTETDLNPRLRYLTLFQLLTETSLISLQRNAHFLNHVYTQLESVFSYTSSKSKELRDSLNKLFSGWSITPDGSYHPLLAVIDPARKWVSEGDVNLRNCEYLSRFMFSVSLTDFCRRFTAPLTSDDYKQAVFFSLDLSDIKYSMLHSQVWTDRWGIPCDRAPNSVLLNPQYTRNSNLYLQAYTASLAISMRNWFNVTSKVVPNFNPSDRKRVSLSSLLQHVGVFIATVGEQSCLTINVPRYVAFLTRMSRVPTSIVSGIKFISEEYPTVRKHERLLFPSADAKYPKRFRHLTYKVVKDLFITALVPEVETANIQETTLVVLERGNQYLASDKLNLDAWFFGVYLKDMSSEFVRRFKYKPLDPKEPRHLEDKAGTKLLSRVEASRKPDTITIMLLSGFVEKPFDIKVLHSRGKTFFGLPWNRFYREYGVLPPRPSSVYKNNNTVAADRGMYVTFYDSVTSNAVGDAEYIQQDIAAGLKTERGLLKPFVSVYVNTPYMFTLDGLYCEDQSRMAQSHFMRVIPRLKEVLVEFDLMSRQSLRDRRNRTYPQSFEPKVSMERFLVDQIAKSVATREANKNRLLEDKKWLPTDSRVRFTPLEDDIICEFYRPGMPDEDKEKLLRACEGHSWNTIATHAKLLCEKLVDAGVTDPTKLPYIRATPRIKKLIEEMNR